jgi:hypothetical protein
LIDKWTKSLDVIALLRGLQSDAATQGGQVISAGLPHARQALSDRGARRGTRRRHHLGPPGYARVRVREQRRRRHHRVPKVDPGSVSSAGSGCGLRQVFEGKLVFVNEASPVGREVILAALLRDLPGRAGRAEGLHQRRGNDHGRENPTRTCATKPAPPRWLLKCTTAQCSRPLWRGVLRSPPPGGDRQSKHLPGRGQRDGRPTAASRGPGHPSPSRGSTGRWSKPPPCIYPRLALGRTVARSPPRS